MLALKRKIKREIERIPEIMVQKALLNIRERGGLMVSVQWRGDSLRVGSSSEQNSRSDK